MILFGLTLPVFSVCANNCIECVFNFNLIFCLVLFLKINKKKEIKIIKKEKGPLLLPDWANLIKLAQTNNAQNPGLPGPDHLVPRVSKRRRLDRA